MRVALDATPLVGARSGVGRFVAELAAALGARPDVELAGWVASTRALVARRDRPLVEGLDVGWFPLPAVVATRLWRHIGWPAHERFVGSVDVVHGTNFVVPPTRAAGRVVTVHDLSYVHDRDEMPASIARFDDLVAWAVRGGAAVHVPSAYVAGEVAERYPGADITVVHEGAPVPWGAGARRDGPPTIVAVGTALRRKRFPLLVEAFGLVAADPAHADARLCLVGAEGPDSQAVEAAVERLPPPVRGRVRLAGRLDERELRRVVGGAAVVAVPSTYEGFGLPVLEAMAAGVPVVATRAGSLPEVAGDAARLVAADDAAALATGIADVLADDTLAAHLAEAGLARAATFTWDATAAGLVALYERVAAGHP